jgi:ferredoxin--NADP+ reductase
VDVGVDVTHAELAEHYTAVIYATGAQTDKSLGIPGEDLPGSRAATEFVAWYNGHPDYRALDFDLSARRAVVIGNGNVAADVTRVLTLALDELEGTDVADHALEMLRASRIEEVVVLGRRGPAQAAFTSAELRELGRLEGVDVRVEQVARRGGHVHRAQERPAAARVRGAPAAGRRPPAHRAALPALAGRDPGRGPRRGDRRTPQRARAWRRRRAARGAA